MEPELEICDLFSTNKIMCEIWSYIVLEKCCETVLLHYSKRESRGRQNTEISEYQLFL